MQQLRTTADRRNWQLGSPFEKRIATAASRFLVNGPLDLIHLEGFQQVSILNVIKPV